MGSNNLLPINPKAYLMKLRKHPLCTLIFVIVLLTNACIPQSLDKDLNIEAAPKNVAQLDSPIHETLLSSTATALDNSFEIADTIILYTKVEHLKDTLELANSNLLNTDFWSLNTWSNLPIFNQPVFDTFYGEVQKPLEIGPYFDNFRPQLSPNNRYLILPGIGGYTNPNGDLGTGLWLADLHTETVRQLLPQAKIVSWNPQSDHIAYVDGDTLYTLEIDEMATPVPMFTHQDLNWLHAHWSPDGHWITAVTTKWGYKDDTADGEDTYWLIPTNSDSPQELTRRPAFAMEHTASEITWSDDSQYLLLRGLNQVIDLSGKQVSASFSGATYWTPKETLLLVNSSDNIRLETLQGDEIALISEQYIPSWRFSNNGQKLAYSQPTDTDQNDLYIYDLDEQKNYFITTVSSNSVFPLRWSANDDYLIFGAGRDEQNVIWAVKTIPNSVVEPIIEDAILVEVFEDRTNP